MFSAFINLSENADIHKQRAEGSGSDEPLVTGPRYDGFPAWSRDGRYLVFTSVEGAMGSPPDIWMVPTDGDQTPVPFLETPHEEGFPTLSPNGGYLAYTSNQSGGEEVYVKPFPSGDGQWLVSAGSRPKWNEDGTELFYVSDDKLMVVDVSTSGVFSAGIPKALFSAEQVGADDLATNYDVSADGQQFVVVQNIETKEQGTITVVQNWIKEFEEP